MNEKDKRYESPGNRDDNEKAKRDQSPGNRETSKHRKPSEMEVQVPEISETAIHYCTEQAPEETVAEKTGSQSLSAADSSEQPTQQQLAAGDVVQNEQTLPAISVAPTPQKSAATPAAVTPEAPGALELCAIRVVVVATVCSR